MVGQAAEQIIAGVVLSERVAVTMYGAIHRAQFSGIRNLRGLIVDSKMLAETGFRIALTDMKSIQALTRLDHANIVPTVAVESGGAEVVVVTRGGGRYVTVQDLIASAKADKSQGGKLPLEVAGAIGKAVIEALAAAHALGLVHGAVHPRSVLVDEDGGVKLTDFVVGRALTTAVAQGADSSLWRGLAGYLAPELVVGEDPTPTADVFAVGAMLFTMLSGEVPPGTLHVTPAVERLVQRALDTDMARRYQTAKDLLENLLEAFEDDRWELAERGELIKAAGLSASDTNIDDATEDLLASLGGPSLGAVQAPIRPAIDSRAEAIANRQANTNIGPGKRLDALLTDLDEQTGMTMVEEKPFKRDPISELIQRDPRVDEAIVQPRTRGLSVLEESDDVTPIPPPTPERDSATLIEPASKRRSAPMTAQRSQSQDESDALSALAGLDEPVRRVSTAAEAANVAATKLEQAAARAEAAARAIETGKQAKVALPRNTPSEPRRVAPILDPIADEPPPTMKIKGAGGKIVGVIALAAVCVGGYLVYQNYQKQQEDRDKAKHEAEDLQKKIDDDAVARQKDATEALADPGSIEVTSNPDKAGVWLKIGRTPTKTMAFGLNHSFELGFKKEHFDYTELQVTADQIKVKDNVGSATVSATLTPHTKDPPPPPRGKPPIDPAELLLQPNAINKPTGLSGRGTIAIDSSPTDAEVWLFIGVTNPSAHLEGIVAGRDYTFEIVKDGYKPKIVDVKADDWREGGDSRPIDRATKKQQLSKSADLEPIDKKGSK